MKLKNLYIKNIASIEEASIDFENGILAQEPLFLICGETGAGKTTILDAICLALYNNTPRMRNAPKEVLNELNKNDGYSNDNENLMRRNTGEACVELLFEGYNEVDYTAKWYLSRANRKVDGKLQSVKWSLENHESQKIYTKINEVKEEIEKAVGLNFEQFCRTSMLAQGDFTKFLKSDAKDKSEILEKLTGTDIFARVGKRINDITKAKKEIYENQKKEIDAIHLLSDEEKAELLKTVSDLNVRLEDRNKGKELLHTKYEWLNRHVQLGQKQIEQKKNYEEAFSSVNTESFIAEKNQIDLWDRTDTIRQHFLRKKEFEKDLVQLEDKENALRNRYVELSAGLAFISDKLETDKLTKQHVVNFLAEDEKYCSMYEKIDSIKSDLNDILEAEKSIKELDNQERNSTKILQDKKSLQETAINRKKEITELLNPLDLKIKSLQEELTALNPEELQQKFIDSTERGKSIRSAITEFQNWEKIVKEEQEKKSAAEKLKKECLQLQQQEQSTKQDLNLKKSLYDQIDELYEKQQDSVKDWACEERAKLKIGDICPICGKEVDAVLSDESFVSLLQPILEKRNAAKTEWEKAQKLYNETSTQLKAVELATGSSVNDWEKAVKLFNEMKNQILSVCQSFNLKLDTETAAGFTAILNENDSKETEIRKKLLEVESLRKKLKSLTDQRSDLRDNQLVKIEKSISDLNVEIEKTLSVIATCNGRISDFKNRIEQNLERANQSIISENWQQRWKENPTSFIQTIVNAADKHKQANEQLLILEQEINNRTQIKDFIEKTQIEVIKIYPSLKNEETDKKLEIKDLNSQWGLVLAEAKSLKEGKELITTQLLKIKQEIDKFLSDNQELNEAKISELAAINGNQITQMRNHQNSLQSSLTAAKATMEQGEKELKIHLIQKPKQMTDDDTLETVESQKTICDNEISMISEEIGKNKEKLATDQKNANSVEIEIQKKEQYFSEYNKWSTINNYFGDATGSNFRRIAQSFVLEDLLQRANEYLRQLTDRYSLTCNAGSLTIQLCDSFQGNIQRPATTLSGGESFIVSLALALGLSSLVRQDFMVDTLFIDEGFGTLSPEYLDSVMTTLERLHDLGGKRIGIISHVEALKTRIPVRIEVSKSGSSSSKVVVKTVV